MKKVISKKVLIISLLLIVLCLTMLILGTFAWYWDGVLHAKNGDVTAAKIGYTFTDLDNGDEGFTVVDWQPGDSKTVNYQIESEGTISQTIAIVIETNLTDAGLFDYDGVDTNPTTFNESEKSLRSDICITTIGLNEDVQDVCIGQVPVLYITVPPESATQFKIIYKFIEIEDDYAQQYTQGDVLEISVTADLQNTTQIATATYANISLTNLSGYSVATIETDGQYLYTANVTINEWSTGDTKKGQVYFHFSQQYTNFSSALFLDRNSTGNFSLTTTEDDTSADTTNKTTSAVFNLNDDNTLSIAIFVDGNSVYVYVDGELKMAIINLRKDDADGTTQISEFDKVYVGMFYVDAMISNQRYYDSTTEQYLDYNEDSKVVSLREEYASKSEKTVWYPYLTNPNPNGATVDDLTKYQAPYLIETDNQYLYKAEVKVNGWVTDGSQMSQIGFNFADQYSSKANFLLYNDKYSGKFAITSDSVLGANVIGDEHVLSVSEEDTIYVSILVNGNNAYLFIDDVLKVGVVNLRSDNPDEDHQISSINNLYPYIYYAKATITNETYYNANSTEYITLLADQALIDIESRYASGNEKVIVNNYSTVIKLSYAESAVFGASDYVEEGTVVTVADVGDFIVGANGNLVLNGLELGSYTYTVEGCDNQYSFEITKEGEELSQDVVKTVIERTSTSTVDLTDVNNGNVTFTNSSNLYLEDKEMNFVSLKYTGGCTTANTSGAYIYMSNDDATTWSMAIVVRYDESIIPWYVDNSITTEENNENCLKINSSYSPGTEITTTIAIAIVDDTVSLLYKWGDDTWKIFKTMDNVYGQIVMIGSGSACSISELTMSESVPDDALAVINSAE